MEEEEQSDGSDDDDRGGLADELEAVIAMRGQDQVRVKLRTGRQMWITLDVLEEEAGRVGLECLARYRRSQQQRPASKKPQKPSVADPQSAEQATVPEWIDVVRPGDCARPLVLIFGGAFNPVHRGHLATMALARAHVERHAQWQVVGGVFVPTATLAAVKKLGPAALSGPQRVAMVRVALKQELPWCAVYPWLALHEANPGLRFATAQLQQELGAAHPQVSFALVAGADSLHNVRAASRETPVVCVWNRPVEGDVERAVELARAEGGSIQLARGPVADFSSTLVRQAWARDDRAELARLLPPAVLDYHVTQRIRYTDTVTAAVSLSPPPLGALPDWLAGAVHATQLEAAAADYEACSQRAPLGSGVNGQVVVARRRADGALVAVKTICFAADAAGSTKEKQRTLLRNQQALRRELDAARRLCFVAPHTHVCAALAVIRPAEHAIALVLPLAEQSLWDRVQGRPLGPARTAVVLSDCARGLAVVHRAGLLHRDVHSRNVLLVAGDRALVADFGHAVHRLSSDDLRGSVLHYAPEALANRAVYTPSCDVYMWAMLAVPCVTGAEVWPTLSKHQASCATLAGERPIALDGTHPWHALVERAWAQDPSTRPSFDAIVDQFSEWVA